MKNKIIPKTDEGLKCILYFISLLSNHNLNYFENTFNYLGKQHLPFKDSFMYYSINENSFKFILKSKLEKLYVKTWLEYTASHELCLLRSHKLAFLNITPFDIVVSNADFLLNNNVNPALYFYNYIQDICKEEMVVWKSLFETIENKDNKLF